MNISLIHLKELRHEVCQNKNRYNCEQTESNIKITTQKMKEEISKYKRKRGWTNLTKIETVDNSS